jgi:NAD(P)-dependent dehydrogenase (short-subunit alcohol dehydrogenase family)
MNSSAERRKIFEPAIAIAPMNRMGTTQEIADACLFMCSSKATFCQGANLVSEILTCDATANNSRSLMADILLISLLDIAEILVWCRHTPPL